MPIKSDHFAAIYEVMRSVPIGHERDKFMYGMVGAMCPYLDEETLKRCLIQVLDDMRKHPQKAV